MTEWPIDGPSLASHYTIGVRSAGIRHVEMAYGITRTTPSTRNFRTVNLMRPSACSNGTATASIDSGVRNSTRFAVKSFGSAPSAWMPSTAT